MTVRDGSPRLALALGIAGLLAMRGAHAQDPGAAGAAYRDRIIAPQQLQDLPPEQDDQDDDNGLPRSFRAEAIASRNERGDDAFDEQGVAAGGFWETASWGAFSLDATLFNSNRDRFNGFGGGLGGAATLWQRNFYLDGGWRVDNGMGVLNTPSPPLQRNQYRFFLPTVAFAGASSAWQNAGNGLLLQGAFGRAGLYTGTRVVGFDIAQGTVGTLGAQWDWAPQWASAASFLGTQGRIVPNDQGEPEFQQGDTQAVYAATAWRGAGDSAQLNVLASDGDLGRAAGAWIDADARRGRFRHNYGAYYLEPGLAWGALPINNDVAGGYYRIAYQYGRWAWNAGMDSLRSLSGAGFNGQYATGYLRYQASGTLGYGGSLNVRRSPEIGYSAQAFADKNTRWGQTRVQFDQARSDARADNWQVSLDQALPLQEGTRLSTAIAYGALRDTDAMGATATTTVAFYGGRDLTDRLSLDGSARWSHGDGGDARRGSDINIALNWRMTPRWSMSAAYFQSQGSQRSPFILDPLVTGTPFISIPRSRSVFLTLRYERSAGRPQAVLGGAPGGPTGAVTGSVFLDDNGDGVRGASEQAAVNVTVLLDGRFAVRTDSLGAFTFPRVSTGSHTLTVVPDNLPLPWFIEDTAARRTVQVTLRDAARVDIGARRQR